MKYSRMLKETEIDLIKMEIFPSISRHNQAYLTIFINKYISFNMIQRAPIVDFVLWITVCTILTIPFQIVCLIRRISTWNIFLTKITSPNHTDFQFWLVIFIQTETLFIDKDT